MLKRITAGIVVVMAGIVLLAYFVNRSDDIYPTPTGEAGSPGLSAFYRQTLAWTACGGAVCSWVRVPVDYAKPKGDTIRLRVKFRPAESHHRIGSLLINPGGPGGSGVDFVGPFIKQAGQSLLEAYDVVGFDPRGVGQSAPLTCLSDRAFDRYNELDPTPDDPAEIDALDKGFRSVGKACVKGSGELAAHVSTAENARDLDILRALMGEKDLDYYGASYGTQLGATYASMFPKSVGSMVLDGAVDPERSKERQGYGQAKGFENALRSFLKSCFKKDVCPLGKDAGDAEDRIVALLAQLDDKPIRTRGERDLTENAAIYGLAYAMYDRKAWSVLTTGLDRASFGDGTIMLALSDQYFGRKNDGTYLDNGSRVVNAIRCLDFPKAPSDTTIEGLLPSYEKAAPVFGAAMAWTAGECRDWPVKSTPQQPIDAKGAPPIMVVGTTRDPATPYSWAKSLAKELDTKLLVTRVGDGHTGYGVGNACVDKAVDAFLVKGTKSKPGLRCED